MFPPETTTYGGAMSEEIYTPHDTAAIIADIEALKRRHNAIILAHSYERGEVQGLADFTGDSLQLSRTAATTDADVILFCGVHFMAETAAILCPDKTVLLPDMNAGCSLANTITAEQLLAWKAQHPNAVVVAYINTTADIKAESDYCCTSSNAVKVVQAIPDDQDILFLPDKHLGLHVQHITGRPLHIWQGACHVHVALTQEAITAAHAAHPTADLLIHPECSGASAYSSSSAQDGKAGEGENGHVAILSTGQMFKHVRESDATKFVIATEIGVLHRMRQEHPNKAFYPAIETSTCEYMKLITLEKIHHALQTMTHRVTVPPDIAARARHAIDRMLEIT